jgi:hypothetical protein
VGKHEKWLLSGAALKQHFQFSGLPDSFWLVGNPSINCFDLAGVAQKKE